MQEKKQKGAKEILSENKKEIIQELSKIGYYVCGLGLGYLIGREYTKVQIAGALEKIYEHTPEIRPMVIKACDDLLNKK